MTLKKKSVLGTALACTLVIGGMTVFATTGQEPPTLKEGTGLEVQEKAATSSSSSNEASPRLEIDSESVESHAGEADLVKTANENQSTYEEPQLIGEDDPRFESIKDEPATINRIESSTNSTTEPRLIITSEEK